MVKFFLWKRLCGIFVLLSLSFLIFTPMAGFAQATSKKVTGVVLGEDQKPLPGATITNLRTKAGVNTEVDGTFSINLMKGDQVEFTYIGKSTKAITYNDENTLTIILSADEGNSMEEVVTTGYQNLKKKQFAGSATTLSAKDVERAGLPDISRMLEGQFAGVSMQNVSGTFGAAPKLRIRGATSLSGDNKPLWVINGVIVEDVVNISNEALSTGDLNTLLGSSVAGINPSDIEDITILRDAAATALYGARAMNGVVVVTTKKGRVASKPAISYTGNYSMYLKPRYQDFDILNSGDQMAVTIDMMNKGYYQMPGIVSGGTGGILYKMYQLINTYDSTNGTYGLRNDAASRNAFLQRYANANTDWFDIIFKNSLVQEHSLSISTGAENFQTYSSVSYLKDEGLTIGNNVERITGNFRLNFRMNDRLKAELFSTGSIRNQRAPGTESRISEPVYGSYYRGFDINPYNYAMGTSRMLTAYDENGNLEYFTKNYAPFNIISELNSNYVKLNVLDYKIQGSITYDILRDLSYTMLGSYQYVKSEDQTYILESSNKAQAYRAINNAIQIGNNEFLYDDPDTPDNLPVSVLPMGGFYNVSSNSFKYLYLRQDLNYQKRFNEDHDLNVFASMESRSTDRHYQYFDGVGYQYENGGLAVPNYLYFKEMGEAGRSYFGMQPTRDRFLAYFGRASYVYKNRYTISPVFRYDGSNKMGKSKTARWLPTWNISGKWDVSQESFWKQNDIISTLALRATYGLTGNIGNATNSEATFYNQLSRRQYLVDQETLTYINALENSELTWEKSKDLDIGLDMDLFKRKWNIQFDYYSRQIQDLIGLIQTSGIGGQSTKVGNYGKMRGEGVEFTLGGRVVNTEAFRWNTRFNIAYNKNKVTVLETKPIIWGAVSPNGAAVLGYPQRGLFSVKFAGLNHNYGYPTFIGIGEDQPVTTYINLQSDNISNLQYEGPTDPVTTGGFYNSFTVKGFTLSGLFKFSFGNFLRLSPNISSVYSDMTSMTKDMLNRWSIPGDENRTTIPSIMDPLSNVQVVDGEGAQVSVVYPYNLYNYSTERVVKGDFIKLSNIMLTYAFPKYLTNKLSMTNGSLSVVANNVWLIHADKRMNGQDPEFFASGGVALPTARQITLSLKLGF